MNSNSHLKVGKGKDKLSRSNLKELEFYFGSSRVRDEVESDPPLHRQLKEGKEEPQTKM